MQRYNWGLARSFAHSLGGLSIVVVVVVVAAEWFIVARFATNTVCSTAIESASFRLLPHVGSFALVIWLRVLNDDDSNGRAPGCVGGGDAQSAL